MKKIILLTGLFLCTLIAKGQENGLIKGKFFVGGSLGYSRDYFKTENDFGNVYNESTSHTVSFLPSLNYVLSTKFSVGLGLGYRYEKTSSNSVSFETSKMERSTGTFQIAPTVNYFIPLGNNKFGINFIGLVPLSFGNQKSKFRPSVGNPNETENSIVSYGVRISPGLFYFPTPKIMLIASLGNIFAWTNQINENKKSPDKQTGTYTRFDVLNFGLSGRDSNGLQIGGYFFF